MVPRGGVLKFHKFKDLVPGGTFILPTGSLGFLARVSHREPRRTELQIKPFAFWATLVRFPISEPYSSLRIEEVAPSGS
jgi:hypothetical protein